MQDEDFTDSWDRLQDEGILEGRLIDHVWREFPTERRDRLVQIMKQFDLICDAPVTSLPKTGTEIDTVETGSRDYYVPSLFSTSNVKQLNNLPSLAFYVDFSGCFTGKAPSIYTCINHILSHDHEDYVMRTASGSGKEVQQPPWFRLSLPIIGNFASNVYRSDEYG